MIQHQGVWLPDGEKHLVEWMNKSGEIVDGKGSYQIKKLRAAIAYCKDYRTAVDIGAHCGLWSMQLVKQFERVVAFEPVAKHRECFRENVDVPEALLGGDPMYPDSVRLEPFALGDHSATVLLETALTSSGDTRVSREVLTTFETNDGAVAEMRTLDSFELTNVDFIKIDTEGYEFSILRGAAVTIRAWRPVIIVEQKPGRGQRFGFGERDAVSFLQRLDYELAKEMSGDFIMVPA